MLRIHRSKSGLPCLWEQGGGMTNTGYAVIIAGPEGEAVRPLYVPPRRYSNAEHALFVMHPGMLVLDADKATGQMTISRFEGVVEEDSVEYARLTTLNEWGEGEWSNPQWDAAHIDSAVDAVTAKANCYHCRCVHYQA